MPVYGGGVCRGGLPTADRTTVGGGGIVRSLTSSDDLNRTADLAPAEVNRVIRVSPALYAKPPTSPLMGLVERSRPSTSNEAILRKSNRKSVDHRAPTQYSVDWQVRRVPPLGRPTFSCCPLARTRTLLGRVSQERPEPVH